MPFLVSRSSGAICPFRPKWYSPTATRQRNIRLTPGATEYLSDEKWLNVRAYSNGKFVILIQPLTGSSKSCSWQSSSLYLDGCMNGCVLKISKNRFCIASRQHQMGVRTILDSIPASEGAVEALAANFLDNFRGRAVEHPDLWSKWRMN